MFKHKIKVTLVLILAIFVSVISYYIYSFEKNSHVKSETPLISQLSENSKNTSDFKEVNGIRNILLIGTDARTLNESSRSDAIIILTLDSIHKNLKLSSIMRDSYVKIPGYGEEKITHAFSYGGADLLLETIENNFNLDLDKYVIVNFKAFQDLVDAIGGLDINVKPNEVNEINKYIQEVNENNSHYIKNDGLQHLDGQQILSYSRIRHVGNGSYERTDRQREVISLLVNKLKDTPVIKYPVIASKLLKHVKTNMDIGQILNYAYTVYKIDNYDMPQLRLPLVELSLEKNYGDKGDVLLMDKSQNAKVLNNFIFEDKLYSKSDLNHNEYKNVMNAYLSKLNTTKKALHPTSSNYNNSNNTPNNKKIINKHTYPAKKNNSNNYYNHKKSQNSVNYTSNRKTKNVFNNKNTITKSKETNKSNSSTNNNINKDTNKTTAKPTNKHTDKNTSNNSTINTKNNTDKASMNNSKVNNKDMDTKNNKDDTKKN